MGPASPAWAWRDAFNQDRRLNGFIGGLGLLLANIFIYGRPGNAPGAAALAGVDLVSARESSAAD